jgi:hypothetical protein
LGSPLPTPRRLGQRRLGFPDKGPGNVADLGRCYSPGRNTVAPTEDRGLCQGRWRNGVKCPVLKHGPRSLTSLRVFGCHARARNESERRRDPQGAPSTGPEALPKDLSKSMAVGTRKMLNYA